MAEGEGHLGGCILVGDAGTFAPEIWDRLITDYQIKSVLDVGCGAGYSLQYFIQNGLHGCGIEGWPAAITASPVAAHILLHDYTKGPLVPDQAWDLAWSCEFVEHVEEQFAENFLVTFESCRYVAMTYAVPGQEGFHHVNCQPGEYWIQRLAAHGFEFLETESMALRRLLYQPDGTPESHGEHCRYRLMLFRKIK